MFEIMPINTEEDNNTYHPAEYSSNYYPGPTVEMQKQRDEKRSLYDRLETQWVVMVEIGFSLSTLLCSCSVVCLMRVFGATAIAFGLAVTAVICAGILLALFWGELNRSAFKLRILVMLMALGFGLSVALSDAAIDLTRHYWTAIAGASISFAVASSAVLALITVKKFSEINAHRNGNEYE